MDILFHELGINFGVGVRPVASHLRGVSISKCTLYTLIFVEKSTKHPFSPTLDSFFFISRAKMATQFIFNSSQLLPVLQHAQVGGYLYHPKPY